MVGRRLADIYPERSRRAGETVLAVEGLSRRGVLADIDLDVRQGEILGICGLAGSGRTELLRALVGADASRVPELSPARPALPHDADRAPPSARA